MNDLRNKKISQFHLLPISDEICDNGLMQRLHKLKYQPALKQSDRAVRSRSFRTTLEFESCFAAVGYDVKAVQITPGELRGSFGVYGSSTLPILSIRTNQGLVVEGSRNLEKTVIGLEQTENIELHRVRGESLNPCSIHGFNARIKDSYFQMSPGAHATLAIFKTQRLQELAQINGEQKLVDCLDQHNSLQLQPEHFKQLKTLFQPNNHTNWDSQESLIEGALLECFHPEVFLGSSNGEPTHQAQLMREMLHWGIENPNNAIKLDDLSATIFASRSSLVQNCRTTFGLGPMTLMKNIRLGQVHLALSHPEIRHHLGHHTVRSISSHYGFPSRNHFARDYRLFFGESPSATLQRSEAPGISAQSVSVAHKPQIAMALR
jgi:AraC family ethanolamine operon transcriptional activator